MNKLNLTWVDGQYFDDGKGWHCRALGYVFEVFAFGSAGFRVYGKDASYDEPFEIYMAPTIEAAKKSVETWLAKQIADMQAIDAHLAASMPGSASRSVLSAAPELARKFAEVTMPLLGPESGVEISLCSTTDGLSGLYFENKETGTGVKVMDYPEPGVVIMFWGTRAELEVLSSREPYYFKVGEIPEYAAFAVKSYLT